MNLPTAEALAQTACEILEDAAFIFATPADSKAPDDGPFVIARLPILGDAPAALVLATPLSVGAEIAANLLGLEPGDPEAESKTADAVGEILNMMAGELAAHCEEEGGGWKFGTPDTAFPGDAQVLSQASEERAAVLMTDGGDRIWTAVLVGDGVEPRS
jgi:hypothetical protein